MPNKNILIIDDEELIRKVLDAKIKSLDYNTFLAVDGAEGIFSAVAAPAMGVLLHLSAD